MNTASPSSLNRPRLVFDFVRSPAQRLTEVESGKAPRESLLGYVQLRDRGWPVSLSDDRWNGFLGLLRQKLVFNLELPSYRMIKHWKDNADIVVVTTRISLILALTARLLRKKIVFLDAMCEEVPKRTWRRMVIKLSLRYASACICLSSSQARHWSTQLGIPISTFTKIHYGIDPDFYRAHKNWQNESGSRPTLLAIGRDPRRDFRTLVIAAGILDWDLILITKSYLVPDIALNNPRIQILDDLSYEELFTAYTSATVIVVPVKRDTTYMSGIRATMEAMLLEIPVIASRTTGMEEYFTDEQELVYFEPENHNSLINAAMKIHDNNILRKNLVSRAKQSIINSYSVTSYANCLENILLSL